MAEYHDLEIEQWHGTLASASELRTQFGARHATLDTEHDERGSVAKLSVRVPIVLPRTREPGETDRGWADLTVTRAPDDRWRLDTRGAGRLVEAAIDADHQGSMSLTRITEVLSRVGTHPAMPTGPDEAPSAPVRETAAPTKRTRWLHGRGPMNDRECGRRRSKNRR